MTWQEILKMKDVRQQRIEMEKFLKEKGMTLSQYMETEEWKEQSRELSQARFTEPLQIKRIKK